MSKIETIVLGITKTKNPAIFMVRTAQGMFSVRKSFLDKRGIQVPETGFDFPEDTVVILNHHKKGDNLFGYNEDGTKIPAPQDSTRLNDQGEPAYKAGEFPVWQEDGMTVTSFMSFSKWKALKEMEKMQQTA